MTLDNYSDNYIARLAALKADLDAAKTAAQHWKRKALEGLACNLLLVANDEMVSYVKDRPTLQMFLKRLEVTHSLEQLGQLITDTQIALDFHSAGSIGEVERTEGSSILKAIRNEDGKIELGVEDDD